MSFTENLQYLRKQKELTQEQLAEQLDVSRQSVSKWESGQSYPEMEKLLQLCSMFHCSMDTLMLGDVSREFAQDCCGYDSVYNQFSRWITAGVTLILAGFGISGILEGLGMNEDMCGALFFVFLIVAVLILVVSGMQYNHFKEKNPWLEDFYTEQEKERAYRKYTVRIALGVGLILVALLFVIVVDGRFTPAAGAERMDDLVNGFFLLMITVAVAVLVYGGLQKEKYNIAGYNKDANPSPSQKRRSALVGKLCGCIMLAASMVYLILSYLWSIWDKAWLVFLAGGILCGIVAVALSRSGDE